MSDTNNNPKTQFADENPTAASGKPRAANHVLKRPKPRYKVFSLWMALPLTFLLGLFTGWLLWGLTAASAVSANTNSDTQVTINENIKRYDVSVDDDPFLGPEDAAITIIEFSDYQCPYCAKWYREVLARLMNDYEGKVRFVYRDFPLNSIHPEAQPAAEAAHCAGEQDSYWKFHDILLGQDIVFSGTAYKQYAEQLGLDMEQFNQCVVERKYKIEVEADYKDATSLGVSSTPTFFVNGLAVVGAQPYEVFKQIIDKELAGEIPE